MVRSVAQCLHIILIYYLMKVMIRNSRQQINKFALTLSVPC